MSEQPQVGVTVDEMVKKISELPEISSAEKVMIYITLHDKQAILKELKMNAFFVQAGMKPKATAVDQFVYGLLRLTDPHLFWVKENVEDDS